MKRVQYIDALRQVHWEELKNHPEDPDRIYKIAGRLNPSHIHKIVRERDIGPLEAAKVLCSYDYSPSEKAI